MKRQLFTCLLAALGMAPAAAQEANPVIIGNARFSFVNEGLVRMEYALDGQFVDDSTLFAVNRRIAYRDVKVARSGNRYTMSTPRMRVEYTDNGFPFGQVNLRAYFTHNGKEKRWLISHSTQRGNLGGAITTLDDVDEPVPLQEGLLSREGWYLIRDSQREVLRNGWLAPRSDKHLHDLYLFVYGSDFRFALRSLQAISGAVPMTRKYVHGAWYCRWWNYTDADYRNLVREYREHGFPLDLMVFDMGWHTQKNATAGTGHAGNVGWTGYSWNRALIPDPGALIGDLKRDGIGVVLNDHPHDGIRNHEDAYPAFMRAMNADTAGRHNLIFDAGSRRYMANFLDYAHGEADSLGAAFWWLDWQQDYLYPVVRGTQARHLPWLNHLYYAHSQRGNLRGAGFSRWAGWGDHRHPIQFSGDAAASWPMLAFEVRLSATSGNAGCFFWAHDIGGFYGGRNPELYTRWTQFGALSSSLRIHSVYDQHLDRRPWLWGPDHEDAMRRAYLLRAQLMPYIYTAVRQCHTDMLPLIRPMYLHHSTSEEAYRHPQQYLLGDLLLCAPVTTPCDTTTGLAAQDVWLPEGTWYNVFTNRRTDGDTTLTVRSNLRTFPLFARGGYPLPMQPPTLRMATNALDTLIVRCYPGPDTCRNAFTLYEDDGLTRDYERGQYATTKMEYIRAGRDLRIVIHPAQGTYSGQPAQRAYRIELPAMPAARLHATVNGRPATLLPNASINGVTVLAEGRYVELKLKIEN